MWLCALVRAGAAGSDPTVAEEPRGREPAALVAQAADAVERVTGGLAPAGRPGGGVRQPARRVLAGPAGRSWPRAGRGAEPADVVVDCFGMMHARRPGARLAERAARVAPGGVLLLQYHSLDTIIRLGQWNSLRHGHYAYYSTTALGRDAGGYGFGPRKAWVFDLYGGTVLLAAYPPYPPLGGPDESVQALLAEEARVGVENPVVLGGLQKDADRASDFNWLDVSGPRASVIGTAPRPGPSHCCCEPEWTGPAGGRGGCVASQTGPPDAWH